MTFSRGASRHFGLAALRISMAATLLAGGAGRAPAQTSSEPQALKLAEAVALARDRSPRVHAALARAAAAAAAVDRSRAGLLPYVALQASGVAFATNGQAYSGGVVSMTTSDGYFVGQGAVNVQWVLWDFGHTSSLTDAARSGVGSASQSTRAAEQVAMAEAAVAYLGLLGDEDFVRSAEEARADREHVLEMTHRMVTGGYRPLVDETRARVALDMANLEVRTAQATRDNDAVTLASALGVAPATVFRLTPPGPIDVGGEVDIAAPVGARGDVAGAAARVEQARHALDAAVRAYLPAVSASGSGALLYARDRATVAGSTTVTQQPGETIQGAITLTVPIFDPVVRAGVRASEAALGEAQAGLAEVTLAAQTETSRAALAARSTQLILEEAERFAVGAAANLAAVEERYSSGVESALALADAEREDAFARLAIVRARVAVDVAKVRVLAAASRVEELTRR
jgi:outer membrane protein TolC